MPAPPRTTVLLSVPKGCHAKPNRGSYKIFSNAGSACNWFVLMAWLYGTVSKNACLVPLQVCDPSAFVAQFMLATPLKGATSCEKHKCRQIGFESCSRRIANVKFSVVLQR